LKKSEPWENARRRTSLLNKACCVTNNPYQKTPVPSRMRREKPSSMSKDALSRYSLEGERSAVCLFSKDIAARCVSESSKRAKHDRFEGLHPQQNHVCQLSPVVEANPNLKSNPDSCWAGPNLRAGALRQQALVFPRKPPSTRKPFYRYTHKGPHATGFQVHMKPWLCWGIPGKMKTLKAPNESLELFGHPWLGFRV
jgi:hypothetical protein